ncbi:Bgt-278 [Blumeria graminis f. sp. tritici]|uniref:ubiquitinyl hydrolase 1 n=2 Tax=Blumeria graminis f. sp. tritici TaxID=62690 RepID=A0A9X9PQ87_BLUGR|nr:Bgt-278 [Blumeria graminis f. sp. tritici]
MSEISENNLTSLLYHIALPTNLPGFQEPNVEEINLLLLKSLLNATNDICAIPDISQLEQWKSIYQSLKKTSEVNTCGSLDKNTIITSLRDLHGSNFVLYFVTEQNAGIMVRIEQNDDGESLVFEVSEASAPSEIVIEAENALVWDFPTSAAVIPRRLLEEHDFEEEVARFLEMASKENIKRFSYQVLKARTKVQETRNSVDPALITGMFMTILKVHGKSCDLPLLRKRVRDDVCSSGQAAKLPWRRSPFWLLLRVAIERQLSNIMSPELGIAQYKLLQCLVHARLLEKCVASDELDHELLFHLHKKLIRRIDKLSSYENRLDDSSVSYYRQLWENIEPLIKSISTSAIDKISNQWESYKTFLGNQNEIKFPRGVAQFHCKIQLANSQTYIDQVLSFRDNYPETPTSCLDNLKKAESSFSFQFVDKYQKLAEHEVLLVTENKKLLPNTKADLKKKRCFVIAEDIQNYITKVGIHYDKVPVQKSKMLLLILELWMGLDKLTLDLFPLLREYSPKLTHNITDVLQLVEIKDFDRLDIIRKYLIKRSDECYQTTNSIFDKPDESCFAVRYFDSSKKDSDLRSLLSQIERDAEGKKLQKKRDLSSLSSDYNQMVEKELVLSHADTSSNHWKYCSKCRLRTKIKKTSIDVFEWPLPVCEIQKKTVVFELLCPEVFSVYRETLWSIISCFAMDKYQSCSTRKVAFELKNYQKLSQYKKSTRSCKLELVSSTKTFSMTNFSKVKLPVDLADIIVPNAANYTYYDTSKMFWTDQIPELTFSHHSKLLLPENSIYASLKTSPYFAVDQKSLTSYSIAASRASCPNTATIQEYLSLQTLHLGYEHRWPHMLIELGSSNINLSTEAASSVINLLALQAGPYSKTDIRGGVHKIFSNQNFCKRLLELISTRLRNISSKLKAKEIYCMDTLITLSLRLYEFAASEYRRESLELIELAREITWEWHTKSKYEKWNSHGLHYNQSGRPHYSVWSSLLFRRTFIVLQNNSIISEDLASRYLETSISINDSIKDDISDLPLSLKAAYIRDFNLAHILKPLLNLSLSTKVIRDGIVAPLFGNNCHSENIEYKNLSGLYNWWIKILVKLDLSSEFNGIEFYYSLPTGLVQFKDKAKKQIPGYLKKSAILQHLPNLDHVTLLPSCRYGMDYQVNGINDNQEIHIKIQNEDTIFQLVEGEDIMELIPAQKFIGVKNDLPSNLINDHVHWLHLKDYKIEIRPISQPLKHMSSNWIIDLSTRLATQNFKRSTKTLLDPNSLLFKAISRILKHVENPNEIMAWRNEYNRLKISLNRLKLEFHVNSNRTLECPQLESQIDSNQDIGTWYGLESKLVLREVIYHNFDSIPTIMLTENRCVLVPIGEILYERSGPHVNVKFTKSGNYARFSVNNILGRIESVDPNQEYLKALIHASTSSLQPDPLTNRTGIEEAFHILNSGLSQPAMPISILQSKTLEKIARLSPRRDFYPENTKLMQMTVWKTDLTICIQHDGLRTAVDQIFQKSQELTTFYEGIGPLNNYPKNGENCLNSRSWRRRSLYERPSLATATITMEKVYPGRPLSLFRNQMEIVRKCADDIREWKYHKNHTRKLHDVLTDWSNFQGLGQPFNKVYLSELCSLDVSDNWGPLLHVVRNIDQSNKFKLTFLLGVILFGERADTDAINFLVAYAVSDKLKNLEPPIWSFYENFRKDDKLSLTTILKLMRSNDDFFDEIVSQKESQRFAKFLLEQWPCEEPTADDFIDADEIDVDELLKRIRPEWRRAYKNFDLSIYLSHVQIFIDEFNYPQKCFPDINSEINQLGKKFLLEDTVRIELPSISDLLKKNISDENNESRDSKDLVMRYFSECYVRNLTYSEQSETLSKSKSIPEINDLHKIISNERLFNSDVENAYAKNLLESLHALEEQGRKLHGNPELDFNEINQLIDEASHIVNGRVCKLDYLCYLVNPIRTEWLKLAGLWPCMQPVSLLETIRSISKYEFGENVKELIVECAISITRLQKLYRIRRALLKIKTQTLQEELENLGHTNWEPTQKPDWLLLEIDSNILIRPGQVDVANATISPDSANNSVLQMNMGQGKPINLKYT